MSYALKPMLRGDDVFELGFDLDGGEAGGVPTTAECLDEKDRGNEALALDDGGLLLVAEKILLRTDDVEIADETSDIARVRKIELATRGCDGIGLGLASGVEDLQAGDVVLNLSESI